MKAWIANPVGHREYERKMARIARLMGAIAPMIDDVWICDICNDLIMTEWEDEMVPVPVDGSYALCHACFASSGGWSKWTRQICACPGCTEGEIDGSESGDAVA